MFQLHIFQINTQFAFSQCCVPCLSMVFQQWFICTAGKMKQWNNAGFNAYVHIMFLITQTIFVMLMKVWKGHK